MAAYAALNSLKHTIQSLLSSFRINVDSSNRESLHYALYHADSLGRTLNRCREVEAGLDEGIIIEAARKLEDAIEIPISVYSLHQSLIGKTFSFNLDFLRRDVDCFVQTAKKMAYTIEASWEQKVAMMIEENIMELFVQRDEKEEEEEEEDVSSATDMVGLSDQFLMIKDKLARTQTEAPVWRTDPVTITGWISGMAGIGKTMLARRIIHDPWVKESFKYRAFVRVGREYRLKQVLQSIATQLDLENERMILEADGSENLYGSFRRILMFRKCLIVLDDVWEECFVYNLIGIETLEDQGSRILVTSRTDALNYGFFLDLKMRFMNEEESWELLRRGVFGEEECPKELVKAGKKIAEKCEGLPLLINVVAPILLSKAQKNLECWSRAAEKPNSFLEDATLQISQVLLSSYNEIDEEKKLCFLYIAAFPQTCIVWHSTINNLWRVEGFSNCSLSFFIQKNLVIGHHENWSGYENKACSLHYTYWFLSKRVAENNKFLYIINGYADCSHKRVKNHRRLAIYNNVLLAMKEVYNFVESILIVRSLLCTGPYHEYQVPICLEWKLLRVLNALTIRFYEFPIEVVKLIRLRYLALTCNGNLPPSIYKLWNLQYLIVNQHSSIIRVGVESYVPDEIWDLQELIYLEIMGRNLPNPPPGKVLSNLRKLLDVGVQSCTKEVLESIPQLEKLRIQIQLGPDATQTLSCFDRISNLKIRLKSFQSVVMNPTLLSPHPSLSVPTYSTLEKLSLSGFGYPWEDMRMIAHLTKLLVLKLQCYAFQGEKWEANEMRFPWLYHLFIEDTDLVQWTCNERETFPRMQRLIMKNCHKLREIPQISNFVYIELLDCNPLAETCAKQKHPEVDWQTDVNNGKMVHADYSWK